MSCHCLKSKQFCTHTLYLVFRGSNCWLGAHTFIFLQRASRNKGRYLEWRWVWRWCAFFPRSPFSVHGRNCPGWAVGGVLPPLTSPFVWGALCLIFSLADMMAGGSFPMLYCWCFWIFSMLITSQVKISPENQHHSFCYIFLTGSLLLPALNTERFLTFRVFPSSTKMFSLLYLGYVLKHMAGPCKM